MKKQMKVNQQSSYAGSKAVRKIGHLFEGGSSRGGFWMDGDIIANCSENTEVPPVSAAPV